MAAESKRSDRELLELVAPLTDAEWQRLQGLRGARTGTQADADGRTLGRAPAPADRKPAVSLNEIRRLHTQVVSALKEVGCADETRLAHRLAQRLALPAAPRPELRVRALRILRRESELRRRGGASGLSAVARRIVLALLAEQGLELTDDRLYRILRTGGGPWERTMRAGSPE